jgi:membrane protein implicated in regulation of membrane protease activity
MMASGAAKVDAYKRRRSAAPSFHVLRRATVASWCRVRTLRRYLLFQIPGWLLAIAVLGALRAWARIEPWVLGLLLALWVAKDVALYPLVRKAYECDTKAGPEQLVGCTGVARERLDPSGYVLLRGELWRAEAPPGERIDPGTPVRVTAARGYTLMVRPERGNG